MGTPMIGGLPSTPGTVRVGATRDQRKGRDRPFEQAFRGSSPPSERPLRMVSCDRCDRLILIHATSQAKEQAHERNRSPAEGNSVWRCT